MSMILPLLQICALKSMYGLPGSHLVVMGTSVRPPNSTAGESRTNATTGFSRNSSSPTKMFDASAPGGIFFIKWRSICRFHTTCSYIPTLNLLFNWNSIATPHSIGFNSPAMLWHSSCRVVCVCRNEIYLTEIHCTVLLTAIASAFCAGRLWLRWHHLTWEQQRTLLVRHHGDPNTT